MTDCYIIRLMIGDARRGHDPRLSCCPALTHSPALTSREVCCWKHSMYTRSQARWPRLPQAPPSAPPSIMFYCKEDRPTPRFEEGGREGT